jgi:hypothetical protein
MKTTLQQRIEHMPTPAFRREAEECRVLAALQRARDRLSS